MYKESKDKLKKSTLVISTIAILLMVTITTTPTMNSSAFDLGLISKDNNIGSIDTSSLFNCVGAAITCDNDNTVNNNVAINNGTSGGDPPNPPTCVECFEEFLTPGEITTLLENLNQPSLEDLCAIIPFNDSATAINNLVNGGLSEATAISIVNCLVEAGIISE
jgi:hypothetical protein